MLSSTSPDAIVPLKSPGPASSGHRETEAALKRAATAAKNGDYREALRWADRAGRLSADSPQITALKAKLMLRVNAPADALAQLLAIADCDRGPEIFALLVESYTTIGREAEARAELEKGLAAFAVIAGDALCAASARWCEEFGRPASGWIGLDPTCAVWGEAGGGNLALSIDGRPLEVRTDGAGQSKGLTRFDTRPTEAGRIDARVGSVSLIGSGLTFPPDFRLDGRCWAEAGVLHGWVRIAWAPNVSPRLVVRDGLREIARIAAHPDRANPGRHSFDQRLPRIRFGDQIFVDVELPGGGLAPLPTSPALIALPPLPLPSRRRASSPDAAPAPVDIIVPVYGGSEETAKCLASLARTAPDATVIVVDDASPDPELADAARRFSDERGAILLRNARNLGFAASVNRALELHPGHDVLIVNADVEAFPGWLERLRAAAYSAADIGTATPLSNNGAIASYGAGAIGTDEAAEIARLALEANPGNRIDAPTGVGFCMYVRRQCLDETGGFDARTFGRGYGEENDFCLRASVRGWRHVIVPDVFVFHAGSASFAESAAALRERNSRLLAQRWPDYPAKVEAFLREDPLRGSRRRLDEARIKALGGPKRLLVTLGRPGGVDRVIEQHRQAITEAGEVVLVLRSSDESPLVHLSAPGLGDVSPAYDPRTEGPLLLDLLRALTLERVELHHFLDHHPALIEEIVALDVRLTVFVHDYSWVCPRVVLLGSAGRYCGEPDLAGCDACIAANGTLLQEPISTAELRARSALWLAAADRVVVPSEDVRRRLRRYFPDLQVEVAPWEDVPCERPVAKPILAETIKVAMIGAIGVQKGYRLLVDCARDAAERLLPVEYVVIGGTIDDEEWLSLGNTFATGRYAEGEIAALIDREAPDVAFFASVTPETFSFSLSHALRARLPIVAFDLGAIAERLEGSQAGATLLPIDSGVSEINNALLAAARSAHGRRAPPRRALARGGSGALAAAGAASAVDGLENGAMSDEPNTMTSSAQLLSLARGLYGFSVKAASPRRVSGAVVLPAIRISAAPGVPAADLAIVDGLRADGGWLFDRSDLVIARVVAAGAAILVTSYSAPGLEPLSIDVARLDGDGQTAAQALPPVSRALPHDKDPRCVPLRIDAHVSMLGDLTHRDGEWVGAPTQDRPVEAFSLTPLGQLSDADIEYRGLVGPGRETAWTPGGRICGVRGRAEALTGLAVRLRGEAAARFECAYAARFASGVVAGPLTKGAWAVGRDQDDPLVGFQLLIAEKAASEAFTAPQTPPEDGLASRPTVGPRFSPFREEIG